MKRREFITVPIKSLGGVLLYTLAGEPLRLQAQSASKAGDVRIPLRFFTAAEARVVEAACDRIFPSDESGPGAKEAAVVIFIDRQLAGRCARQGDPGMAQFFISFDDEIVEAFGEKPAARLRKRYGDVGRELTSLGMRRLFVGAQHKKERQHFKDRKLLMHYEKQRAEMRKNMGLNPVLG